MRQAGNLDIAARSVKDKLKSISRARAFNADCKKFRAAVIVSLLIDFNLIESLTVRHAKRSSQEAEDVEMLRHAERYRIRISAC